jgi:hypothetical protein
LSVLEQQELQGLVRAKAHWAWAWAENIGAVLRTDKVSASPGQPRQSRGGNGFFNSPRLRKYLVASFALLARSSVNPSPSAAGCQRCWLGQDSYSLRPKIIALVDFCDSHLTIRLI